MFEVEAPQTKTEIATALKVLAVEIATYLASLDEEEFRAPQGAHWSPAGHLRHLAKSVRAVARGLRMPKAALLFFGLGGGTSRSFSTMWALYRRALDEGGQAGAYGPSVAEPTREVVMERWRGACSELDRALAGWSEKALDRYRLPHPLLGRLTGREMLFFTLFHNAHHARRIRERSDA